MDRPINSDSSPLVAVVVLNYNTKDLLKKLIPFILKTNYSNFKVVVADNDSSDDSTELVRAHFPEVEILEIPGNLGYAGGYNYALDRVDAEYFVLLNSDVEVDPDWLQPMIDLITSSDKIAAVQPKILQYDDHGKFEYAGASGGYMDRWGYPFCRGRIFNRLEDDHGQYDDNKEVFWASGAALLIRADLFQDEKLDEDFFAHMEEIDLCWRLKNRGYEIWTCGGAKVFHIGGGTLSQQSSRKTFLNFRNNLAMLTKNLPSWKMWLLLVSRIVFWDLLAGVKFLASGEVGFFKAVIKAHWSFFGHFKKWHQKRKGHTFKRHREHAGFYGKSIAFQFFIRGKRKFSDLPGRNSE